MRRRTADAGAGAGHLAAYTYTLDEGPLSNWPGLFTDTCLYRITTRLNEQQNMPLSIMLCDNHAMLYDRVEAVEKANIFEPHYYRHILSDSARAARARRFAWNGDELHLHAHHARWPHGPVHGRQVRGPLRQAGRTLSVHVEDRRPRSLADRYADRHTVMIPDFGGPPGCDMRCLDRPDRERLKSVA